MNINFSGKTQQDIIFDITRSGNSFFGPGWQRMFETKICYAVENAIITSQWVSAERTKRAYTIRLVTWANVQASDRYPMAPRWNVQTLGTEASGWDEDTPEGLNAYPTLKAAKAALKRYLAHKEASWQY